jgi:ribosome-binding factor A
MTEALSAILASRMRKTRRTSRVGESVRDALVEVFRHDLKDSRYNLVSITGVDVSPDLHYAKVFLSGYVESETRDAVAALQEAKGRVRHFLGQRIRLRYTPELDFRYDETSLRASRIETLLSENPPIDRNDDLPVDQTDSEPESNDDDESDDKTNDDAGDPDDQP